MCMYMYACIEFCITDGWTNRTAFANLNIEIINKEQFIYNYIQLHAYIHTYNEIMTRYLRRPSLSSGHRSGC